MEFDNISEMIDRSRKAQKILEGYSQQDIDEIVKTIAKTVYDNAEVLAGMAVDETGMGVYEDKVKKNQGKSKIIWNSLKGKKSVGIIEEDRINGITKIAKPMGVVGAVVPCTNPIVTPMCNAMFAIKARNSIVIAPHPRAKKCAGYTIELINASLKYLGAPENLIQTIEEPTIEKTNELMSVVDIVVATGGMGMVKAAYSSGKPAYGVGAGNIQCILDKGVDISTAVEKIISGRIFDNGIICSGEQMIIVHEDDFEMLLSELEDQHTYLVRDSDEIHRLRNAIFNDKGIIARDVVGQPIEKIAAMVGLNVPEQTRMVAVEVSGKGRDDLLCKEKMCPVIGIKQYSEFEEAVEIAESNLDVEGKGHSAVIHSNNEEHIRYAGENLKISRLLVNQICATMNGGSFVNGLSATTTLGCGSWGNNIISENLDFTHLMNITRISTVIENAVQPTDEEIWA